jgi:hypothetical protein
MFFKNEKHHKRRGKGKSAAIFAEWWQDSQYLTPLPQFAKFLREQFNKFSLFACLL